MQPDSVKKDTQEHWSSVPIGTQTEGFDQNEPAFDEEYFTAHSKFRFETYAPWLRDAAGFDRFAGKDVLEVGCGMGTDLLEFARGNAHVVGIDLTPTHIKLATKRFDLFRQTGTFVIGDAEHLPFPDASFDHVYSNGVLHHTPGTQEAINEIHRVLRPGGTAQILLYHKNSLVYYLRIMLESGSKRFVRHMLNGKRLREFSLERVLSASTDGETNPLTKVYTRRQAAQLMQRFSNVRVTVHHLRKGDFPLSGLVPASILERLSDRVGWYVVMEGTT